MKKNLFKNGGIVTICALIMLFFACKRTELSNILGDGNPEAELRRTDAPLLQLGDKQVTFLIGSYNSVKPNFRDTAEKAFEILSEVLSSKDFQDSIAAYSFPCSNAWFSYNVCANPGSIIVDKCDPVSGNVLGTTVYDDYLMEDTVTLNVNIYESSGTALGSASACNYQINTNEYWLTNDRTLPLSQEYAIHVAHEYGHVVGYFHSSLHSTSQDVCYRIGGIVRNILWKWHLEALQSTALHTQVQSDAKFRFLAVNPPSMPQVLGFDTLLQADIANTTLQGRSYNHFYLDFNPPTTQRKNGSNVVFGVTTASGSYWIEYNYYLMQWVNSSTGIVSFTYKDNNGSNPTTLTYSQNLRQFLENHTFKIEYSNDRVVVGKVMGRLVCVEEPSIYFYGQFEKNWSNW